MYSSIVHCTVLGGGADFLSYMRTTQKTPYLPLILGSVGIFILSPSYLGVSGMMENEKLDAPLT